MNGVTGAVVVMQPPAGCSLQSGGQPFFLGTKNDQLPLLVNLENGGGDGGESLILTPVHYIINPGMDMPADFLKCLWGRIPGNVG